MKKIKMILTLSSLTTCLPIIATSCKNEQEEKITNFDEVKSKLTFDVDNKSNIKASEFKDANLIKINNLPSDFKKEITLENYEDGKIKFKLILIDKNNKKSQSYTIIISGFKAETVTPTPPTPPTPTINWDEEKGKVSFEIANLKRKPSTVIESEITIKRPQLDSSIKINLALEPNDAEKKLVIKWTMTKDTSNSPEYTFEISNFEFTEEFDFINFDEVANKYKELKLLTANKTEAKNVIVAYNATKSSSLDAKIKDNILVLMAGIFAKGKNSSKPQASWFNKSIKLLDAESKTNSHVEDIYPAVQSLNSILATYDQLENDEKAKADEIIPATINALAEKYFGTNQVIYKEHYFYQEKMLELIARTFAVLSDAQKTSNKAKLDILYNATKIFLPKASNLNSFKGEDANLLDGKNYKPTFNRWANKMYSITVSKYVMALANKDKEEAKSVLKDFWEWTKDTNVANITLKDKSSYYFNFDRNDNNKRLNNFSKQFDMFRNINRLLAKNVKNTEWGTLFDSINNYINNELIDWIKDASSSVKLSTGIQLIGSFIKFLETEKDNARLETLKTNLLAKELKNITGYDQKQGGWSWAWDTVHNLLA